MTPDPIAFNAQLAAVEAAMNEPVSAELAAAYERIAELENALRPMADVASDIPDGWDDDHQCVTACGHFRRASAALNEDIAQ